MAPPPYDGFCRNRPLRFLADPGIVRARLRPIGLASFCLASLATLAWTGGFDASLTDGFARLGEIPMWRTAFNAYSRWSPFLFYLSFLVASILGLGQGRGRLLDVGTAYLMAQLLGSVLLTHLLKIGLNRTRPHVDSQPATDLLHALHSSFPSSHTVDAAVGAFLVLLLARTRGTQLLAVAAAVLMGTARLVLGRHYLSDVLAGLALGAASVVAIARVYLLPRWQDGATTLSASADPYP